MHAVQTTRIDRGEPQNKDPYTDTVIDSNLERDVRNLARRLGTLVIIDRHGNYTGPGAGNIYKERVTVEFPSGNAAMFSTSQNRLFEPDGGNQKQAAGWHYFEPSFNIGVRVGQTWLQLGEPGEQFGNRHLESRNAAQMREQFMTILRQLLILEGGMTTNSSYTGTSPAFISARAQRLGKLAEGEEQRSYTLEGGRTVIIEARGDLGWKLVADTFEVQPGQFEREEFLVRASGAINDNASRLLHDSQPEFRWVHAARPHVADTILEELAP